MNTKSASRIYLVLIIVVAGLLRITFPGLSEFKADEARLYASSLHFVNTLQAPVYGITSSIGVPNFPISTWIYAIPLTIWQHPYSATIFTGLLNTGAVILCWYTTKRYWNTRTALIATLLFATSPWAVIFSRKIWAQNTLPIFVGAWALTGLITCHERRKWPTLLHGLLIGCIPQIHFSGLALIPISLINLILCRKSIAWKWFAIGAIISLSIASPLAIYLNSSGWDSISSMIANPIILNNTESIKYYWMLSTGSDIHSLTGPTKYLDFLASVPNYNTIYWFWTTLIIIGCLSLVKSNNNLPPAVPRMMLSWLLIPLFLQYIIPYDTHLHYFIITFPVQYIIAAVGANQLFNIITTRIIRTGIWTLLLASASLQVWYVIALLQFVLLHNTPHGFGTPLSMTMHAINKVQQIYTDNKVSEILIIGEGNDPGVHEFPAIYDALLNQIPHRFVDWRYTNVIPNLPSIALYRQDENQQVLYNYYQDLSQNTSYFRLRQGEGSIVIADLPTSNELIIDYYQFDTPNTLENRVTILGYSPVTINDGLGWVIHWTPRATSSAIDYHFFNHLYDSAGTKIGQSDAASYPSYQWKDGDRVMSLFTTSTDTAPKFLKVGMYTYPDMQTIYFVGNSGKPVSTNISSIWHSN
jgi:hypothetical protein